ncbi:MAG: prolyl oligopeptidase family serine peptidase, partial [Vibrio ordalii]
FTSPSLSADVNARVSKDIVYKTIDGQDLKLNVYFPKTSSAERPPLLIWIHGGAWKRGSKEAIETDNRRLLDSVLDQGYALAAVDYRLSGQASFPQPVIDINDAINFLHQRSDEYHFDAKQVVLMGRSAGGHLAGLIGTLNAHRELGFPFEPKYQVAAVVSFFGPMDLLALGNAKGDKTTQNSSVSKFLGAIPAQAPELAKQASPISYVSAQTPPFLLLHGNKDKQVPIVQSIEFQKQLDQHGIENQLLIEPDVGHSAKVFDTEKYVPAVITFIQHYLPVNN